MSTEDREQIAALYDESDREVVAAARQSKHAAAGGRIDQLGKLAQAMGVRHIGIAYCVAFADEAERLAEMLRPQFEVTAVDCKVFDLQTGDIVAGADGGMCNPAGQAKVLNDAGCDLSIEMGLCLGHDMIFRKHSNAPVTVLTVKDRATDHNPLSALS